MLKRWYLNFLLLIFLLSCYFFIQYQSAQVKAHALAAQLSKQSLLSITTMQFDYTSLDNIHHSLRFVKENGHWVINKPGYAYANYIRINHLLSFLQEAVKADYDSKDKDLSLFGLSDSKMKARYNNELFILGDRNRARGGLRYVLHNGRIKLLSESLSASIRTSLSGFVAYRLFAPDVKIVKIDSSLPLNKQYLNQSSALIIASYKKEEVVIDHLTVYLNNNKKIIYDVLKSDDEKFLLLGLPDLQIKYTLDRSQVVMIK